MGRRLALVLATLGLALGIGAAAQAQPAPIAGRYLRTSPALGELTLTPAGDQWRIEIGGSAHVAPSSATPADCEIAAVGPYRDGRIEAKLVRDGQVELDEEGLARQAIVELGAGRAVVLRSDVDGLCGSHSDLTGTYRLSPLESLPWVDESDLAFATRVLGLNDEENKPHVTAASWNGAPTLFVDYETGAYEEGKPEPERPVVALIRQPSGVWRKVQVTLGECEGGRPDVAAIAFANADRDPAKELIVILRWSDTHAFIDGDSLEVRILDDAKPGAAALRKLKIGDHFGLGCNCTRVDGEVRKPFRYQTAAAVKAELKRLGY